MGVDAFLGEYAVVQEPDRAASCQLFDQAVHNSIHFVDHVGRDVPNMESG